MTSPSTMRRALFNEIAIGTRFFDPISQEYFVKKTDEIAVMVTGIGDGTKPDEFEPDDVVRVPEQ